MGDRSGNVSFENFGLQVLPTAAANRLNEVYKMVTTTAEFFDFLSFVIPCYAAIKANRAAFTIHNHSHLFTAKVRHFIRTLGFCQIVNLIQQRRLRKIIIDYLCIGDITCIVEYEPATNTHHPAGKHLLTEAPAGHIHFVVQPAWNHQRQDHQRPGPSLQADMFSAGDQPPREEVEAFCDRAREVIRDLEIE